MTRPIQVHAILETASGMANVEAICQASPRMQGISLGPADLAADRRMKTTRVGGGHPGYLVRQDPTSDDGPRATYQQDLWHYTVARMVDACVQAGIYAYYGPFGDIKDTVACEDQFRNAYLLGCVGTWTLHPVQVDIAKRVFSPEVADVQWAKRVVEEMPEGGAGAVMIDGKMQDDATFKQCQVVLKLAQDLAARDPELAGVRPVRPCYRPSCAPSCTCRPPTPARWRRRSRSRRTRSSSTSRTPSPRTPRPWPATRRAPLSPPASTGCGR